MLEWTAQKKTYRPGAREAGTVNGTCDWAGTSTCSHDPSDDENVCRAESRLTMVKLSPAADLGCLPERQALDRQGRPRRSRGLVSCGLVFWGRGVGLTAGGRVTAVHRTRQPATTNAIDTISLCLVNNMSDRTSQAARPVRLSRNKPRTPRPRSPPTPRRSPRPTGPDNPDRQHHQLSDRPPGSSPTKPTS